MEFSQVFLVESRLTGDLYVGLLGIESLVPIGYTDFDFQSDIESRKSTSGYVFNLGGGVFSWRSVKQSSIADSTMETEYIAASKATKEAIWLKNFLMDLGVVPSAQLAITL